MQTVKDHGISARLVPCFVHFKYNELCTLHGFEEAVVPRVTVREASQNIQGRTDDRRMQSCPWTLSLLFPNGMARAIVAYRCHIRGKCWDALSTVSRPAAGDR